MLLSLKKTNSIPKEISVFNKYLNVVKTVTFNISRRGLSMYK